MQEIRYVTEKLLESLNCKIICVMIVRCVHMLTDVYYSITVLIVLIVR